MNQQKSEFLAGEADAWFRRNAAHLSSESPLRDLAARLLAEQLAGRDRGRVLEIGCGSGENLVALGRFAGIDGHGIEPSKAAVDVGQAAHPSLQLRTGTADALPFDDSSFDAVWFGFCLYLVDRELLASCVAEADRVLRDGGTLCIVDFDPDVPCRRAYHHLSGMWSYKMDYSRLFLSNPAYRLSHKSSVSHGGLSWHPDPQERIGIWLLRKDLENAYVDR
jgi:SAM-dependent methyltransferase